jgi:hypothetical protein
MRMGTTKACALVSEVRSPILPGQPPTVALNWQMGHRHVDTARRWGIGLTAVAVLLWLVIVAAVVTAAPEDGANIGAGLLFLLAIPCTVAGATLLITTRRAGQLPVSVQPDPALSPTTRAGRAGAPHVFHSATSWDVTRLMDQPQL